MEIEHVEAVTDVFSVSTGNQVVGAFHVWWPIAKEKGAQQILGSILG